jgi:hypothetical protein
MQLVCGGRGVLTIGCELPNNVIIHIRGKVDVLDQSPKLDKMGEVLQRCCGPNRKLNNPLVIVEGLGNLPILPLANFEHFRSNIFRSLPL